jgi:hypothetical protein
MFRKKALAAAAALALGPLAFMAPANAYYRIGDCDVDPGALDAGVTLTVVRSGPHWDVTGRINDGHGRYWRWALLSNCHVMYDGSRTGTGNERRYWVPRPRADGTEKIEVNFVNGALTVACNATIITS